MKLQKGFTLVELMITVAIIAILASVALPIYNDYVTRGRIADATSVLANRRVQAEQYFQDNRTYDPASLTPPSPTPNPACVADTTGRFFDFSCPVQTALTFTVEARGKLAMAGFNYTINEANLKTSPLSGAPPGWTAHSPDNCWVTGKGGTC